MFLKVLFFIAVTLTSALSWALPTVRVAFSLDKPPYVNPETGSGLEVEILRRIFLDMGYSMIPAFQPPARSVRSLELGRVDAMATITNMPKFHLSDPYITFHNYAWTLKSKAHRLTSMSDLEKRSVIAFQNARFFLGNEFSKAVSKSPAYQEKLKLITGSLQALEKHDLFPESKYSVAFRNEKLRDSFNKSLNKIRQRGDLQEVFKQYAE